MTYVINLDDSTDRLETMQHQLSMAGMKFTRIQAVRGADLPIDVAPFFAHVRQGKDPILLPAEIGCYASHLRALRHVVESDAEVALILEDDAAIPYDLSRTLSELLRVLPRGWDFVHLCKETHHSKRPIATLPSGQAVVRYSRLPSGSFGYLVSRSGARKLTDMSIPRFWAVDVDYRRPWMFGVDAYGVSPPIIGNLAPVSTISSVPRRSKRRGLPRPTTFSWTNLPFHTPRAFLFNVRKLGLAWWAKCFFANCVARIRRTLPMESSP